MFKARVALAVIVGISSLLVSWRALSGVEEMDLGEPDIDRSNLLIGSIVLVFGVLTLMYGLWEAIRSEKRQ